MSSKNYLSINVYDAVQQRLKYIFDHFDNILVSFSGGKDSGVLLNLAYDYAKKNDLLDHLSIYTMDYEAGYQHSFDYIDRTFKRMKDVGHIYRLCLPISAQCACSMYQSYWIPWDKDKQNIWVRQIPQDGYSVTEDNVKFDFKKGTYGADARKQFDQWFADKYGDTAVLIGLRADESLARLSTITSQHRSMMYEGIKWSKKETDNLFNFYPLYDWKTSDIWVANAKFGYDYNKIYDLFYQAGLSIDKMRIASPFRSTGQANLRLFKALEPNTWSKMVGRVNGANFTGLYGGTTIMGWKSIKLPKGMTWKEYAFFLIKTLPDFQREKLLKAIKRLETKWSEVGYGRNPQIIQMMKKAGANVEETGKLGNPAVYTKKGKTYQIVKIKNGFVEDSDAPDFRHIPSWKGVCVTILKNDFTLQTMGLSRTKEDMKRRRKAMEKYANIL